MSVACISIPLQHPVEPNLNTVDVGIDELPDVPVETVLQILKDEGCVKSDIYFQFAVSAALPTPSEGGGGYPSPSPSFHLDNLCPAGDCASTGTAVFVGLPVSVRVVPTPDVHALSMQALTTVLSANPAPT